MDQLRFDGRVAVVTGAGRGIGRAYANLLAERGAKVVVNDLGGAPDGEGSDAAPAQRAASAIVEAGGIAVADTNDVSTPEGGKAIIDTAIEAYGRVDVLVNNAGIVRYAAFPELDLDNLHRHVAVHVYGSFNTTRAAWPHFVEQGYGRIVLTGSTGMFGMDHNASYAIVKSAMIGFANSVTLTGAPHGIKINTIAPNAMTRLGGAQEDENGEIVAPAEGGGRLPAELVAPMVAYLAHEDVPVSGELLVAGGGRFARLFLASTPGYAQFSPVPTIEDVAANWDAIVQEEDYFVPESLMGWAGTFFQRDFVQPGQPE